MSSDEERRFGDHLLEYVRDSTLWPVLLVAVAIFATIGGAVLLAAWSRNLFALAALVLLAAMSVDAATRELRSGGFGGVCVALLLVWVLSGVVAAAAVALGLA